MRLDLAGAVLATIGLGGLVFFFIEAPARGWSAPEVLLALGISVGALLGFILVERQHPAPMLPLALLRNRNFAGANLITLLLYAGLGGGLFFLPLNLIQVQGLSATAAGAALLPFILIMFLLSRWAGRLVDRHGARPPLIAGPADRCRRLRLAGAAGHFVQLLARASCPASPCWASAWRSPSHR